MSENGTALARTDDANLPAEAQQQIQSIRTAGAVAVAQQKALNDTTRQLAGMKWGDVSGQSLSVHTRYAIAQLCQLTGANPAIHLYILGGRPYLNGDYWAQVVADNAFSLGYDQRNISASNTAQLRKLAAEADKDGEEEEARALRREARELDRLRASYGIPENAVAAYETIIRRYAEHAPVAAIATGRVDGTPFVIEYREANWAGGKKGDPVGDARPAETARSRSLRRAAVKAFATTLQPMEDQLRKLEEAIEAEFTVITDDQQEERAALPAPDGPQAVRIGAGEPEAARAVEAEPLPVQEATAVVGNARAEKKKFEEGCRVFGIDDAGAFIRDHLGHEPTTLADFRTLNAALAALADGEQDEAQEGLGL